MKRYRFITFIIINIMLTVAKAQMKFPGISPLIGEHAYVDVPSPTAASLGRYGDVGVSFFTGNPKITIPIYEFDVRGIKMPISLDYDASGIMPNSLPSWAGQNWTLNVGGVITRTVKSRYDEWEYPEHIVKNSGLKFTNYFKCHGKLNEYVNNGGSYKDLKENVMNGYNDFAPDEYTFHFMGKSGKFFLDQDGNWRVQSNENLEILYDYTNKANISACLFEKYPYKQANDQIQMKTISGFVIRDDDGNRYTFGYDKDAIEYTTNFWRMSVKEDEETWHASCWYLTDVTDKYGNVLYKLKYQRGAYIIQVFNAYCDDDIHEKATGMLGSSFYQTMSNNDFPYTVSISSPVYLCSIEAMNGVRAMFNSQYVGEALASGNLYKKLYYKYNGTQGLYFKLASMVGGWTYTPGSSEAVGAFYYLQNVDEKRNESLPDYRYKTSDIFDVLNMARLRQLRSITIDCLKANTHPSVYYDLLMSYANNRMRLDSIRVEDVVFNYDKAKALIKYYKFKYNKFEKLPSDYLTPCVDHWGYYNGIDYYKHTNDKQNFSYYRSSNADSTSIGILNEIVYPTGGVTDFEYELNTYGKKLSNDRQSITDETGKGGGLRIKSIKSYDSADKSVLLSRKDYFYNIPGTGISSGELFATPMYYWKDMSLKCEQTNATYRQCIFHTSSVVPLANSTGINLGYSYVTEDTKDIENPNRTIEKHIYHYSNISDPTVRDKKFLLTFGDKSQYTPYDEWSELGFKKGILLNEQTYDGNGKKVEAIGYKYRNDDYLDKAVLTSNLFYDCYGNSAQYAHYTGGVYKLYYPQYDIVGVQDTLFNNDGSEKMVTAHLFEKKDLRYKSAYQYGHEVDKRLTVSETTHRGIFSEKYSYTFGDFNADKGYDAVLYKKYSDIKPLKATYERNGRMLYEDSVAYYNYWTGSIHKLLPHMIIRRKANGVRDTITTYDRYTETCMPRMYKEKGKPAKFFAWGGNDCYLTMVGDEMITEEISAATFYDEKQCLGFLKYYVNSHPFAHITGYVWNPLFGITAIIKPNEDYTTYKYDNWGRLSQVFDKSKTLLKEYKYNYRK